ncbi:hypothetical protein EYF80_032010 [Liparis tanakae]|uniref:Uncharacterized protein n=1 Tax=Liparis tanakae TaxID=230148 RepID=A0A4Z2GWC9_9TELE|nr:hypothetical protein EYF80_032010 [Liparis tanakae]
MPRQRFRYQELRKHSRMTQPPVALISHTPDARKCKGDAPCSYADRSSARASIPGTFVHVDVGQMERSAQAPFGIVKITGVGTPRGIMVADVVHDVIMTVKRRRKEKKKKKTRKQSELRCSRKPSDSKWFRFPVGKGFNKNRVCAELRTQRRLNSSTSEANRKDKAMDEQGGVEEGSGRRKGKRGEASSLVAGNFK